MLNIRVLGLCSIFKKNPICFAFLKLFFGQAWSLCKRKTKCCDEVNKNVLFAQFFQFLIQAYDLLFLDHLETNVSFPSLGFVSDQPFKLFFKTYFVVVFQSMNVLIIHNYGLFYVYDLFLSWECGHWVKTR
jgi:hypothetical protein